MIKLDLTNKKKIELEKKNMLRSQKTMESEQIQSTSDKMTQVLNFLFYKLNSSCNIYIFNRLMTKGPENRSHWRRKKKFRILRKQKTWIKGAWNKK